MRLISDIAQATMNVNFPLHAFKEDERDVLWEAIKNIFHRTLKFSLSFTFNDYSTIKQSAVEKKHFCCILMCQAV